MQRGYTTPLLIGSFEMAHTRRTRQEEGEGTVEGAYKGEIEADARTSVLVTHEQPIVLAEEVAIRGAHIG